MKRIAAVSVLFATAVAAAGCGLVSPGDPPGQPSSLVAEAQSPSQVLLTWAAPSGGGDVGEYEIERAVAGGGFELLATLPSDASTYTDGSLTPDQDYAYRVRACNGNGCSEYSSEAATRTLSGTPVAIETYVLPPVIVGGTYEVELTSSGGGGEVTWSLAAGTLPAGLSLDPTGVIGGTPSAADTAALTLRVESFGATDERDFVLLVVPHDETQFNITPLRISAAPDSIQPHVDSAIVRWERVITGNVQAAYVPPGTFDASSCLGFGDAVNGTTLDDIIVLIDIESIDGPGKVLGRAGPCAIRSSGSTNPNIPAFGLLQLDVDDLGPITGTETLTDLIFHEIGHVLGYGALWSFLELVAGSDTDDPRFTGTEAAAEWVDLGGSGDVPLANTGDSTTVEAHWRESTFGDEVMTGYIAQVGTDNPLSRVTIASMEDLGYAADRAQADDYTLSAALQAFVTGEGHERFDQLLGAPIYILDPDGTVHAEPLRPW